MSARENRVECPVCKGSGHDKVHTWPDGLRDSEGQPKPDFAACEGCEGYGMVTRAELHEMKVSEALANAKRALAGDSNDAEHDALFELVEALGASGEARVEKRVTRSKEVDKRKEEKWN